MSLIITLGGAGYHAECKESSYKSLLRNACSRGIVKNDVIDGVAEAISVMENSSLTNAGYGSSLNRNGEVEMDAIIQNGTNGLFGSVGAIARLWNPIQAAKVLIRNQLSPSSPEQAAGLVQPSILIGSRAEEWCVKNSVMNLCDNKQLISPESESEFKNHSKTLELHGVAKTGVQDTVGAIHFNVSPQGEASIAAGLSSGGSIMKCPGRIGPAAVIGTGCWCENNGDDFCAVIASGEGEYIMQKTLARTLTLLTVHEVRSHSSSCNDVLIPNIVTNVLESTNLFRTTHEFGLVMLYAQKLDQSDFLVDLIWINSTPTMALGYKQRQSRMATAVISRKLTGENNSILTEGRSFLISN